MLCTHSEAQWQWQDVTESETLFNLQCLACHEALATWAGPPAVPAPGPSQAILPRPKMWGDWHAGERDFIPPTYTQEDYDTIWGDFDLPMPIIEKDPYAVLTQ